MPTAPPRPTVPVSDVVVLFAGDSGDGMQVVGGQFTMATAHARNDLATLPDFPAEIRAPAGTLYGVSGFQLHFGSGAVHTPGDTVDLLVAMNPAALKTTLGRVRRAGPGGEGGGAVLVNTDAFGRRDLDLAGYAADPLADGTLAGYEVHPVALSTLTARALDGLGLSKQETDRAKNMFALGLALWLYTRPVEPARAWIAERFAKVPRLAEANRRALDAGYAYGDTVEGFVARYEVAPAPLPPGRYRAVQGNEALALGLVAASDRSGLPLFYGTYPITPASDLLHALARHKAFGVRTFQAEDEIAAVGAAVGASFGGALGVTATSGPGLVLKAETMGLAVMTELPLVVVDVQRAGPSTGMPTKTEQSDLMTAVYGRHGEAPLPVLAARTPGDCFWAAYEACRVAVEAMTPVVLLSDGYLGNGSEPWLVPDAEALPPFAAGPGGRAHFATRETAPTSEAGAFLPYVRDPETLARPWAVPGTPGLEHRVGGLEKDRTTGGVSYDPLNHAEMVRLRAAKVAALADRLPPVAVEGDVPADGARGDVLFVGWGSTYGAIKKAAEALRADGLAVGHAHLRWLNPFPRGLAEALARYDRVVVPELNDGQLVVLLRSAFLVAAERLTKIQGLPLTAREIVAHVREGRPEPTAA